MSVKKAIDNILDKNLTEMKQNFTASLNTKAVGKLEEKKIVVAQNFFAQTTK